MTYVPDDSEVWGYMLLHHAASRFIDCEDTVTLHIVQLVWAPRRPPPGIGTGQRWATVFHSSSSNASKGALYLTSSA